MCQINQIITGCGSLGPLKNNYQKNIAHNVLHLTEVGDYEAQKMIQKQMFIRRNNIEVTAKPPILVRCCYKLIHFFSVNSIKNILIIF